jgi:hypothetical protein
LPPRARPRAPASAPSAPGRLRARPPGFSPLNVTFNGI